MAKKIASKTAKKKIINQDNLLGVAYGDRIAYGLMSRTEEQRYLKGDQFSARTDYGRAINIRIPQGYHAQAKKAWEMYSTDRLFKYLVDRCIDFAANGFEWELPPDVGTEKLTQQYAENNSPLAKKLEKEKKFWDGWSAQINKKTSNIMPGIDEINKWISKQLLLGGMAPMEWKWGTMEVNKVTYKIPIQMTTHNVLSTLLERTNAIFLDEKVKIKLDINSPLYKERSATSQVTTTSVPTKSNDWHEIPLLGQDKIKKTLQGFVIKYNWTPGDNTSTVSGSSVSTGQGLYPHPPFYGLNEALVLRRQLYAADIAILDGIINYIVDWSIGDNTKDGDGNLVNQPEPATYDASGNKIKKSTIETVKEMITTDNRSNVMQLFHPYYYKLDIITPKTDTLLNNSKYVQTVVEIFMAFGILLSPTDRRVDFTEVNIANFEQMLENIRQKHIKRFWETLCTEIVEKNEGKLSIVPNMIFNPLNTQDNQFREGLLNLAKMGKVSIESLLKAYGLDKNVETNRIAQEISNGEKELMDSNVPVSFVQETVNPEKEEKKVGTSATKEGGRPQKGNEEEEG